MGKFTKKINWGGGGVGLVGWGQGGCERRIEVFVKIRKKKKFFFGGGGSGGGGRVGGGGSSGYVNEELNFFVKIQKKNGGGSGGVGLVGGGGGVRVDVNKELKFL